METLLCKMKAVVTVAKSYENLSKVTSKHIHKETGKEAPSIAEAIQLGLNMSEYETTFTSPSRDIITLITGKENSSLSMDEIESIESIVQVAKSLSFKSQLEVMNKELKKANSNEEEALKVKRVQFYIDNNEEPRKSFKDYELYEKMKKEQSN